MRTKLKKKIFKEYLTYCEGAAIAAPSSRSYHDFGLYLQSSKYRKHYFKFLEIRDKKLNQENYRYLLTFTLKPESVDKADTAEEYIKTQTDREALKIVSFAYVKELTKNKVPHWHAVIETEIPVKRNRFQYYEKLFGHVDISRTKGQTTQEALNYISKDSPPIVLK